MRCPECVATIPAAAEFCPACGTPTSARLRESRAAEKAVEDPKRNRRTYFIVGAAFVFGLVIGGQAFDWDPDFDFDAPVYNARPAVADAQQIFQAYEDDEGKAEEKFGGRPMVVTGEFVRVVHDGQGHPDIRLKTSDPERPLGADLAGESYDASAELQPGQKVTLSCEGMAGGGDDRWLRSCTIQEAALAPVAPTAPASPAAPPAPPPPNGNQ